MSKICCGTRVRKELMTERFCTEGILIKIVRILLRSPLNKDGTKTSNASQELFEKVAIFDVHDK